MKKNLVLLFMALLAIASCKTPTDVEYMQDVAADTIIQTQQIKTLKLVAGDILLTRASNFAKYCNVAVVSSYSYHSIVQHTIAIFSLNACSSLRNY
mgnify:CR=1 FL=1